MLKINFENQILALFDVYFWPFNKSHEKVNIIFVISAIIASIWNVIIKFRWCDEKFSRRACMLLQYGQYWVSIFQHKKKENGFRKKRKIEVARGDKCWAYFSLIISFLCIGYIHNSFLAQRVKIWRLGMDKKILHFTKNLWSNHIYQSFFVKVTKILSVFSIKVTWIVRR